MKFAAIHFQLFSLFFILITCVWTVCNSSNLLSNCRRPPTILCRRYEEQETTLGVSIDRPGLIAESTTIMFVNFCKKWSTRGLMAEGPKDVWEGLVCVRWNCCGCKLSEIGTIPHFWWPYRIRRTEYGCMVALEAVCFDGKHLPRDCAG